MNQKGEHPLASGNVVRWERVETESRGTLELAFMNKPTPEDVAEAMAFASSDLIPENAQEEIIAHGQTEQVRQIKNEFLYGGSSN